MIRLARWGRLWRRPQASPLRVSLRRAGFLHGSSQHSATPRATPPHEQSSDGSFTGNESIFRRLQLKGYRLSDANARLALIETCLPSHLREDGKHAAVGYIVPSGLALDVEDVAELLTVTQKRHGIDLLYYLAIEQSRWDAAVWLVKHLVENFASKSGPSERLAQTIWPWSNAGSIQRMTEEAIDIEAPATGSREDLSVGAPSLTLQALTDDLKPEDLSRRERLQHDLLGAIWQSLGAMTIACAMGPAGEMMPEVLEIIAFLHHNGLMPGSIYNYVPSSNENSLQQPPILHLLSSRILTALSDAAWRAHERLVVEEAKAKGGAYASLRPEIPGTAYRVRVASVKPEIWLELILWSCLYGRWVKEGAEIISNMHRQEGNPVFRPLAWRDCLRASLPFGQSHLLDWDKLKYDFDTRHASTMDDDDPMNVSLKRTVSAEVVNAYIDALLSMVAVGVGDRGIRVRQVLTYLSTLRDFLERSNLGLGAGSWDAIVLRLVESGGLDVEQQPAPIRKLAELAPTIGKEVTSSNTQNLPAYVLDGSAATIGLLHRALRAHIDTGDVEGALRTFSALQQRTDQDKYKSLMDFFSAKSLRSDTGVEKGNSMFISNFAGIDYPAFDSQIPTTILGPLLDLVTNTEHFDIGHWLLHSTDLDGPAIPENLYHEPSMTPTLIRYATATKDTTLLQKVLEVQPASRDAGSPRLPRNLLQSFLDSQFRLKYWDASVRILEYMRDTRGFYWNISNVANLVRVMLLQATGSETGDKKSTADVQRAKTIFADVVSGVYDGRARRSASLVAKTDSLLALLAAANVKWAALCSPLLNEKRHFTFALTPRTFNIILDGILEAYGTVTARRLLDLFWPYAVRRKPGSPHLDGVPTMPRFEPSILDNRDRIRTTFLLPGLHKVRLVMYGGLQPNIVTILMILRKALEESRASVSEASCDESANDEEGVAPADEGSSEPARAFSPSGMAVWAAHRLRELGIGDEDIRRELRGQLGEYQMERLKERLPDLFEKGGNEGEG